MKSALLPILLTLAGCAPTAGVMTVAEYMDLREQARYNSAYHLRPEGRRLAAERRAAVARLQQGVGSVCAPDGKTVDEILSQVEESRRAEITVSQAIAEAADPYQICG